MPIWLAVLLLPVVAVLLPIALLIRRHSLWIVPYQGRNFKITGYELEDGQFVTELCAGRREALRVGETPVRLLKYRNEFRRIANWPRVHAMITCLEQPDEETVRLAIWLLGRKHAQYGIPFVEPFSRSQHVRVRREAARALRRLGAWSELRAIYEYDTDDRVCRIAMPEPPKPFTQRLVRFTGDANDDVPAARHSRVMSFFVRVPIGPGRPAKPSELIQAILERIHRLVHG